MKLIIIYMATIFLASCSSSSGVINIGADTFTISTSASPGKGGVPAAKQLAYQEASHECAKRGNLEVFTISEKASSPTWTDGMARMDLNFRCLRVDASEFKQH